MRNVIETGNMVRSGNFMPDGFRSKALVRKLVEVGTGIIDGEMGVNFSRSPFSKFLFAYVRDWGIFIERR